jgi:putative membrane protein insertion efficiency factor
MRKISLFLIRVYQRLFSPLLGRNCRFYPTCSAYTHEAIKKYGLLKGVLLGGKRLLKCHPFHSGGVDLVP